jgi:CheY-like chemotaxis protein
MHDLRMFLVEDNPADIAFFQEALEESGVRAVLEYVENGRDALRYLRRLEPFKEAAAPEIIVLDLNLPIKNGREVLLDISQDPQLSRIPVAVLTTSDSDMNICALYPDGRCIYFTKPLEFSRLVEIVQQIAGHALRFTG